MKKCTAIICEYNPFHNGHAYQLTEAKKFSNVILCIMSGNTIQRGGFSIADKYDRARIAIKMGADIVIEHPFPYCMSSAADFAFSGVYLANSFGADALAFGHESEREVLIEIADILYDESSFDFVKSIMESEKNLSFPKARQQYLSKIIGEDKASVLKKPNNILSVEYLLSLKKYPWIEPCFIKREEKFLSASGIREKISNYEVVSKHIPVANETYFRAEKSDMALLAYLNLCGEYEDIYDCDSSLYYRIQSKAKNAKSINELISASTSSAYTSSKVRRCIYSIFFGTKKEWVKSAPSFSILLGASRNGLEYLSQNKKNFLLPLVTRAADCKKYNLNIESNLIADRLYCLFGEEDKYSPFKNPYIEV